MRRWLPAPLIAAGVVFAFAVYSRLPETLPIHWNLRGQPNGYATRAIGAFALPGAALAIWALVLAVPYLDPRRQNIEKFRDAIDLTVLVMVGVMILLHVVVLGSAIGWPVSVARVAPFAVGLLFVVLGNFMPRFRSNFFFGIRTPWTLSSDQVWMKTHRLGGYLMVAIGVLLIAAALIRSDRFYYVTFAGAFAVALISVLYSYFAWRAETRNS